MYVCPHPGVKRPSVVVCLQMLLAGRVAESALFGASNITIAGSADIMHANYLAREMVYKCGWSDKLGPVNVVDSNLDLRTYGVAPVGDMGVAMATAGLGEIQKILAACEAKAYFGLVCNWHLLEAMVDFIMNDPETTLHR
jgi:cell division protease FtsH